MNRRLLLIPVAGLAGALLYASPAITAPGNKFSNESEVVHTHCDGGTVTYTGPLKMWPPNHKYQPFNVTALADNPEDDVTYSSNATHDEIVEGEEMQGAGNTPAETDVDPATVAEFVEPSVVSVDYQARSERSGRGDGRTYTLDYTAQFGDGEPCMDTFTIEVPHDMRGGASWK